MKPAPPVIRIFIHSPTVYLSRLKKYLFVKQHDFSAVILSRKKVSQLLNLSSEKEIITVLGRSDYSFMYPYK